jgi:chromosome segregation ATPase
MDIGQLLVGGGIGTIVATALRALVYRRKLGADTASVLTKAAAELVQPLTERIHELEAEVEVLRTKVHDAAAELERCHNQIRAKDARIARLTRGAT